MRAAIQRFVRGEPGLAWARRRAPRPSLRWRAGEALHFAGMAMLLVLALPLVLVALPFYVVVLRIHERREPAPHLRPDFEHAQRLSAIEDRATQNQFSAIGLVKPGRFRALTVKLVLFLIELAARHVFTRADLAGVKTIHFAHWTVLDGGRRVIFTSNYDGSLESYMDDFIDKVSFGLNASFSNGVGFPRARFLLLRRRAPRAGVQGPPAAAPDPDAGLLLRLSAPDRAQHRQQRLHPLRAVRDARTGRHESLAAPALMLALDDIQGLVVRGYGKLPEARFLLAAIERPESARALARRARRPARRRARAPGADGAQRRLHARRAGRAGPAGRDARRASRCRSSRA